MARQRRRGNGDTSGTSTTTNDTATDTSAPLTDHDVLAFLCKSVREREHWRSTKALARCLGVPYARLLLSTRKDDSVNLVWATVLALCCCATRLAEFHDAWYDAGDAAVAWLHRQPHYIEHREDLVQSACALMNLPDAPALLATLFAAPKSAEELALEAALGDWKQCYLQEPPYSLYYWNERTNHSTWRNPLETAKQQQEALEQRQRRAAILVTVLPQRLRINRDVYAPPPRAMCSRCHLQQTPREATVLCLACSPSGTYFCAPCCDRVHCERALVSHCATSFRFRECVGARGFPSTR